MPSYTPTRFIGPALLTGSVATLYTAPAAVLLRQLTLSNTSSVGVTARVHLVPVGASAATSNIIVPDYPIAANDITFFDGWQVLNAGDMIAGFASNTNVVVLAWSGVLL